MLSAKLVAVAIVTATVCQAAVIANPVSRPAVVQQQRDDDCGAAALALAMQLAGEVVDEKFLLRFHNPNHVDSGGGLTAADLVRMTAATGTGLTLKGRLVRTGDLSQFVSDNPVIVLIEERGKTGGFGHFVLVEAYSPERGFLVADPAVGKRGFKPAELFLPTLRSDASSGQSRILALHLQRSGLSAAKAIPLTADEERSYPLLETLRRRHRTLSDGKAYVTLSVGQGKQTIIGSVAAGVSLSNASSYAQLSVRRGVGNGFEVGAAFGMSLNEGILDFGPTGSVPISGGSGVGPLVLSINRSFDLGSDAQWSGSWGAAVGLEKAYLPTSISANVGIGKSFERMSVFGNAEASVFDNGGRIQANVSATFGVGFDIGKDFQATAYLMGDLPIGYGSTTGEIGLQIGKQLGKDWAIEALVSQSLFGPRGYRSHQVAVSLTYAIPNRLNAR